MGLQEAHGFSRKELNDILSIIEEHHELIIRRWNEYFDN
ncbi:MAG: DUF4160 domain-containing protein [Spirochaetales bacterium]|nr:DUF4160 domain-containing protein [Spirochaetales bacterium]